ncbi:MAG: P27 family phage terminase small subunit [Oscillospiraceae bacterium]|nr:P27 family phage terminase small subunit [Oscillospiraceae bacterium]
MAAKATWRKRIKAACEEAGTYEPFFDLAIDQLAGIMEARDAAEKQYKATGKKPVIQHTNKGGATNLAKNPMLVIMNECNQQALAYWKELGLTSKAYSQMQKNGFEGKKEATLGDLLSKIGI